jgi:hypothetical protein
VSDADIIPFPSHSVTVEPITEHDEEEQVADEEALAEYLEGQVVDDEWATDEETEWESEPDMFTEADGQWVWLPHEEDPTGDVPVGMVAFTIATRCRWMHRHLADGLRAPQTCCYSVLVSTARLPGPVRTPRHWLAEVT